MKVCILCESNVENKSAVPIREDFIIRSLRGIKRLFGMAKMNELYICEPDLPKYGERRKSFEKSLLFSTILSGFLFVAYIFITLLSGRLDLFSLFSVIIICGLILVFPLFRYVPAINAPLVPPQVVSAVSVQSVPPVQSVPSVVSAASNSGSLAEAVKISNSGNNKNKSRDV